MFYKNQSDDGGKMSRSSGVKINIKGQFLLDSGQTYALTPLLLESIKTVKSFIISLATLGKGERVI